MTNEAKKPSGRVRELWEVRPDKHFSTTRWLCAIETHLDEEHARRQAFEADVLRRLDALEADPRAARAAAAERMGSISELARADERETEATCLWCRKTYAEHLPQEQPNRPIAKCPCFCWREKFTPAESPIGVYVGDGHPQLRRGEDSGRYEASEDPE